MQKLTGVGDGLLGVGLDGNGLVALSVDEVVVDDLDAGVVGGQQSDLVGNGLGISEGRDVLADVGEAQNQVVGVGTGQLGLGLLAENNDVGVGELLEDTAGGLAQTGVDTTAKTLVGAGDDEQSLLVVKSLGLGLLENGVGGLTVVPGLAHSLLGAGETGGGNDLHGVGDLFDVLDGLETALDFTQGREVGGIGRRSAWRKLAIEHATSSRASSSIETVCRWREVELAGLCGRGEVQRRISGVDGDDREDHASRTYRVTAALPALTAGRTARENIVRMTRKVGGGLKNSDIVAWRGEGGRGKQSGALLYEEKTDVEFELSCFCSSDARLHGIPGRARPDRARSWLRRPTRASTATHAKIPSGRNAPGPPPPGMQATIRETAN